MNGKKNKKAILIKLSMAFYSVELARFELASGQNVYTLSSCLAITWFSNYNRRYYQPILILASEFCFIVETPMSLFQFGDALSNSIGKTISEHKGRA